MVWGWPRFNNRQCTSSGIADKQNDVVSRGKFGTSAPRPALAKPHPHTHPPSHPCQTGTKEDIEKYSKRTVRVTREHNAECRRLLQLLGVPIIDAPSEAEAQCASLCKQGLVYGIATEDMDALTFGTPRLIRHLMSPASTKQPVMEFEYDKVCVYCAGMADGVCDAPWSSMLTAGPLLSHLFQVVEELKLTRDQFIDLCILCGCDYTEKIGGIGPFRALQVRQ